VSLERIVATLIRKVEHRFYGKYRGIVVDNVDPEHLGRLKVRVPSVLGSNVVTGWALPCAPYGGDVNQGFFFVPEVGAGVWVEFEEGDLEFPIWVGTFWSKPGGDSEVPKPNKPDGGEESSVQDPPTRKIIKTKKGHTIQFEDADGNDMVTILEAANNNVITMDGNGVRISDGKNKQDIVLDSSGVTISDMNGNKIVMGSPGIQIGSSGAAQQFVLGTLFKAQVTSFIAALSTHTHIGNMGAPTSPPVAPMELEVPLSSKHKVE